MVLQVQQHLVTGSCIFCQLQLLPALILSGIFNLRANMLGIFVTVEGARKAASHLQCLLSNK